MSDKTTISTANAPAPAFVFSQGIRKGPLLTVSGQGAVDPATNEYVGIGDVAVQTTRTLENVRAIVEAGGATFEDVAALRVFLTTQDDFAAMNEAYAAFIAEHIPSGIYPTRTTVFTGLPREEMLVEIDAIAFVD
ncbi:MAG: Rid family hydrolase [Rhodoglobus sp.]